MWLTIAVREHSMIHDGHRSFSPAARRRKPFPQIRNDQVHPAQAPVRTQKPVRSDLQLASFCSCECQMPVGKTVLAPMIVASQPAANSDQNDVPAFPFQKFSVFLYREFPIRDVSPSHKLNRSLLAPLSQWLGPLCQEPFQNREFL